MKKIGELAMGHGASKDQKLNDQALQSTIQWSTMQYNLERVNYTAWKTAERMSEII